MIGHLVKENESTFTKQNLTLKDLSTNILSNIDDGRTHNITSISHDNSHYISKSPKKRSLLDAFDTVEDSDVKRNAVLMSSENKLSVFTCEESAKCRSQKEEQNKNNTSTTFKWAKSFQERFTFRNSQITSSTASNNEFKNPRENKEVENNVTEKKNCTEISSIRNPFKAKKENDAYSLGSQGSSERDDSFDECDESENVNLSMTSIQVSVIFKTFLFCLKLRIM